MSSTDELKAIRFGVVILAAGASARMGTSKLLLPWGTTSVIGHLIQQWRQVGAEQVAVVGGSADSPLQAELDRLDFPKPDRILNPAPDRGMFSSIQCAARWPRWNGRLNHWVIALGDQPHLRPATLRALIEFGASHPEAICQPSYLRRARHPVWFPKAAFKPLADTPETTLKDFLKKVPEGVSCCELDDPGLELDIDQPADYAKAIQLYRNHT